MSSLKQFLNQHVSVITTEGKYFVGVLDGYDHAINLVLRDASERVVHPISPYATQGIGTFIIRGELVATVGLLDIPADKAIDWDSIHGQNIGSTKHSF